MTPLFLLFLFSPTWALKTPDILRIGILSQEVHFTLRVEGPYRLTDLSSGHKETLSSGEIYQVTGIPGKGIRLGAWNFSGQIRLSPMDSESKINLLGKGYRDTLLIQLRKDGRLTVINELGLEGYLYGVLSREMSPGWPREALKAQAVVSRTFALKNLGRYGRHGFDLSSDVSSQVYAGMDGEDAQTTAAVLATEGEALIYGEKLLESLFHACCGGRTQPIQQAWGAGGSSLLPLSGVRDRYCRESPYFEWQVSWSAQEIEEKLHRINPGFRNLRAIRLGAHDPWGGLKNLRFLNHAETLNLPAKEFRRLMGLNLLRSAQILRVRQRGGRFHFLGRGWGHRVGLCQWGARAQAQEGRSYKQILRFYYPGARISHWKQHEY